MPTPSASPTHPTPPAPPHSVIGAAPASPTSEANGPLWHTSSSADCARTLEVEPAQGLSAPEANARLQRHGPNRLAEPPPRPLWRGLLDQFKSMLIIILLVAAVIAAFIGDMKSVTVILVVVCFNAVLGFWQEYRAEKTLAALKNMLARAVRADRSAGAAHASGSRHRAWRCRCPCAGRPGPNRR